MRLFIAINFQKEIKDYLQKIGEQLKDCSFSGNFTNCKNFHLTLVFIGEVLEKKVSIIKATMNKINTSPFELLFSNIGSFKREGGDIFFIGVKKCEELQIIYNTLSNELLNSGFNIEKREYKPHLTLAREVMLKSKTNITNEEITTIVNKISLMKSERINGKLIYSEIYSIFLK